MKDTLAYIHPDARIGSNVKIDPFATIQGDVVIGDNTWIGSNATIMDGARIGKNVHIFPGAVVSAIPQDLKFKGETSQMEIGDSTTIREFCTLNRGTAAKGKTVIGKNCLLMAYVHIAHDCALGDHVIISNSTNVAGEVEINDYAVISAAVQVHQFVHIGAHVMISGGSLVRKDVPPYITAAREPLTFSGLNSIGLKRRQFATDSIRQIQDMYRIIYQDGYNNKEAIRILENDFEATEERDVLLQFLKHSTRGIIKGYNPQNQI